MEAMCPYEHFEEVSREGDRVFLAALVHKDNLEEFEGLASRFNLERVQFPGRTGTVRVEMELLERELAAEKKKKEAIEEEVRKRLPLKPDVCTLQDYLRNQLNKEEAKERLVHTERVVALEGWVEESRAEEVVGGLEELGVLMDVSLTDPEEGDIPPTLLVNRRRVKPAENLINLFGLPNHDETDPTPYVSPFFIHIFGICK
jgi:V/A-type H+-transporting ATPase subunit I